MESSSFSWEGYPNSVPWTFENSRIVYILRSRQHFVRNTTTSMIRDTSAVDDILPRRSSQAMDTSDVFVRSPPIVSFQAFFLS